MNETPHEETRRIWNENAAGWDERMADGNDFARVLIWPAVQRLLQVRPGCRIVDVACGNGISSRRFAEAGARVTAFDFADALVALARGRGDHDGAIDYRTMDATDEDALRSLGDSAFDAAHCGMALFDMAEIAPLFRALAAILKPGAPSVFSLMHPCFNNPNSTMFLERPETGPVLRGVRTTRYMTSYHAKGRAMSRLTPHVYFHRSLQDLLAPAFACGFAITGLEERAFPADGEARTAGVTWDANMSEIPPVMVVRMVGRA